ncbi:MAG TPA: glycoside hydrolase family 2 TIM barrel-domain containing protein [Chitinophagaceae bacterium]|nr:glycoside hydrolase family 2 TIM barrel-domain containing protein [Chitinophagaceae bacterium]
MKRQSSTKNTKLYTKDATSCSSWFVVFFVLLFTTNIFSQQTEKLYLSGTGNDNTVNWEFFCTAGLNAGKRTTIPVPSCWELQGFGKYDYGFAKDSIRGKEKGLYKHSFNVPSSWKGKVINIVFEGVMTDAEVKINGKGAGPVHQGAFYAFKYDISKLLKYGKENILEVIVSKHSANQSVNAAERRADFWIFGGIFRPVWLEVLPGTYIQQIYIDARANGSFTTFFYLYGAVDKGTVKIYDNTGKLIFDKDAVSDIIDGFHPFSLTDSIHLIKPWSPESPDLYSAVFTIYKKGNPLHTVTQKFGFRTIEVKQRDGIYINGVKVKLKGVNRHSFWPASGRTTSKKISIDDVLEMKDMNMNAVRMSHYPPDDHFLDACDSLGLFVMDELAGWHGHYDTPTGTKLLKEMIDHDGHHPSIIIWSNGNEGGHNLELDSLFTAFDVQKRPVVHPWQLFGGVETQHYREYNYGIGNYENGREIVMPTEFLHGQFDGGHGAGLEDYWEKMWRNPLSAGGFLWDFADQGVIRKDKKDSLDTDKHRGADGIVGPYHEKEGSYYAIKEIWSPVYFERKEITDQFDGNLIIENRFHFTNINQCSFYYGFKTLTTPYLKEITGTANAPAIKPGEKGILKINLPADWRKYHVLYVTVKDKTGKKILTKSFPIIRPSYPETILTSNKENTIPQLTQSDSLFTVKAKGIEVSIHKRTGLIIQTKNEKGIIPFSNGPIIEEGINNFSEFTARKEKDNIVIGSSFDRKNHYNTLEWTVYPTGIIKMQISYFPVSYFTSLAGVNFSYPENRIKAVTYMGNGPYRVWKNRMKGTQFGVWTKSYNNTETGEAPWIYPEFKGYHSNLYWSVFKGDDHSFKVITTTEDIFLRLFTPAWKTDQWHNYEPVYPKGDISFMQGISSIGTKTQRNETTGPMGLKNIFYDYEKDPERALKIVLYFDFKPLTNN